MQDTRSLPIPKRNICFVSNYVKGEYTGRYRWALELQRRGHKVTFVLPANERPDLVAEMRANGVAVTHWTFSRSRNSLRLPLVAADLRHRLQSLTCDVIHSFGHVANICTAAAGAPPGIPVHAHITGLGSAFIGAWRWPVRALLLNLYRMYARRIQTFVFQNSDDAAAFPLSPSHRKVIIPGTGVDTTEWRAASPAGHLQRLRHDLGLTPETPAIAYVGRLHKDKGIAELEQAWRSIAAQQPAARLLLIGDDDLHAFSAKRRLTSPLRSLPGVISIPWTKDVKSILQLVSAVVIPSHREGLPRVAVEAMALSKPVIASDVAGCRHVVDHGVTGLLFPVRDAQQLASSIDWLLRHPARARAMGIAGRDRAVQIFSLKRIVDSVELLYAPAPGDSPSFSEPSDNKPAFAH